MFGDAIQQFIGPECGAVSAPPVGGCGRDGAARCEQTDDRQRHGITSWRESRWSWGDCYGHGFQVSGEGGRDLCRGLSHYDGVVMSEATETVQVDCRFATEDLMLRQGAVVKGDVIGVLVASEAYAVPGTVEDRVAEPALFQDPGRGSVCLACRVSGHKCESRGRLCVDHRLERPGLCAVRPANKKRALVFADVSVELRKDDIDESIAGLNNLAIVSGDAMRTGGTGPGSAEHSNLHLILGVTSNRLLRHLMRNERVDFCKCAPRRQVLAVPRLSPVAQLRGLPYQDEFLLALDEPHLVQDSSSRYQVNRR